MGELTCPICNKSDFESFLSVGNSYFSFNKIECRFVICKNDGLVINEETFRSKIKYEFEYWQNKIEESEVFISNKNRVVEKLKKIIDFQHQNPLNILDLGSGEGNFIAALYSQFPENNYLGIEPDRKYVECLNSIDLPKNVEFQLGRITDLVDILEDRQDIISLLTVFEHLQDLNESLEIISDACRAGGIVVIMVPTATGIGKMPYQYWYRNFHNYYFSNDNLSPLLSKHNFKNISTEEIRRNTGNFLISVYQKSELSCVNSAGVLNDVFSINKDWKNNLLIKNIIYRLYFLYKFRVKRRLQNIYSLIRKRLR